MLAVYRKATSRSTDASSWTSCSGVRKTAMWHKQSQRPCGFISPITLRLWSTKVFLSTKKLNLSSRTTANHKRGQSRIYLQRRLRSLGVSRALLWAFEDTVVASVVCYATVLWGEVKWRTGSSVLFCLLNSIQEVTDRMLVKLTSIMGNTSHCLHHTVDNMSNFFSSRLLHP